MKIKQLIVALLIAACFMSVYSQDTPSSKLKHGFTITTGENIYIGRKDKNIYPGVVQQRNSSVPISVRYTIIPFGNWGGYVEAGFSVPLKISDKDLWLKDGEQESYGVAGFYSKKYNDQSNLEYYYNLGITYYWESKSFSVLSYGGVTITEPLIESSTHILKEKGTNSLYKRRYDVKNNMSVPVFYATPGVLLNCRISSNVHLTLDINYRYALRRLKVYDEKENMYTKEIVEENFRKISPARHLGIKLGFSFGFN